MTEDYNKNLERAMNYIKISFLKENIDKCIEIGEKKFRKDLRDNGIDSVDKFLKIQDRYEIYTDNVMRYAIRDANIRARMEFGNKEELLNNISYIITQRLDYIYNNFDEFMRED